NHVPYEIALPQAVQVLCWYEQASDAGVLNAGLVLAQLVLQGGASFEHLRGKAQQALEAAAHAGLPEAQWMLAHQSSGQPLSAAPAAVQRQLRKDVPHKRTRQAWCINNTVTPEQYATLDALWRDDRGAFLTQARPQL